MPLLLGACASYVGSARRFSPERLTAEPGWVKVSGVPFTAQRAESDCGAAAIGMVVGYWTGRPSSEIAARLRPAPPRGLKAGRLRELARGAGLAAFLVQGTLDDLERELDAGRPVLVGLVKLHRRSYLTHYEVVVAWHPRERVVVTLDPAAGWRENTVEGFVTEWRAAGWLALVTSARHSSGRQVP